MSVFFPRFDQLPDELGLFPLPGALLLPGGNLPLRIFEPRYLQLFDDALSGSRLVGMVQPTAVSADLSGNPEVFKLGCAGRITSFSETDEGHLQIELTGLIRFSFSEELKTYGGSYRRVKPNFEAFRNDLEDVGAMYNPNETADATSVSPKFLATIQRYFEREGIEADLKAIEQADLPHLVATLAMSCPFGMMEKQALLEAKTVEERQAVLMTLMEMASADTTDPTDPSNLN